MAVKFVKPNQNLVDVIARDMRQADVVEVWEARHLTPLEALMDGWSKSELSAVVTVDKKPCVMLGLVVRDVLSDIGSPWLLGTNEALKHKRQFVSLVEPVLNHMFTRCSLLYNWVHSENHDSIRWLKRIGFIIDEPEEYGINKAMFHKFHLGK